MTAEEQEALLSGVWSDVTTGSDKSCAIPDPYPYHPKAAQSPQTETPRLVWKQPTSFDVHVCSVNGIRLTLERYKGIDWWLSSTGGIVCGRLCVDLNEAKLDAEGRLRARLMDCLAALSAALEPQAHADRDAADDTSEHFVSRGIGQEWDLCCFVCGARHTLMPNIAAFVTNRESGGRVVAMFSQGARLDYRDYEPNYVQVKIGACPEHLPNLQSLSGRSRETETISRAMIGEALFGKDGTDDGK